MKKIIFLVRYLINQANSGPKEQKFSAVTKIRTYEKFRPTVLKSANKKDHFLNFPLEKKNGLQIVSNVSSFIKHDV